MKFRIFSAVLNWLGGGIVGEIGEQLNIAYQAKLNAQTNAERTAADKVIATLEARRSVLVEESRQTGANAIFRVFLALPFGLFVWKVIVYDKILALGVTDDLSDNLWKVMAVVYGFYFVYETAALFKRR